jgi:hypothetical protein
MVCQYSTPGPVSSEKHQVTPGTEVDGGGTYLDGWDWYSGEEQLRCSGRAAGGQQPDDEVRRITEIEDALEIISM